MSELERLAKVAHRAMGFTPVACMALEAGAGATLQLDPEAVVRAVLQAMRDLDDPALEAAAWVRGDHRAYDLEAWQRMIDAILEGK